MNRLNGVRRVSIDTLKFQPQLHADKTWMHAAHVIVGHFTSREGGEDIETSTEAHLKALTNMM